MLANSLCERSGVDPVNSLRQGCNDGVHGDAQKREYHRVALEVSVGWKVERDSLQFWQKDVDVCCPSHFDSFPFTEVVQTPDLF